MYIQSIKKRLSSVLIITVLILVAMAPLFSVSGLLYGKNVKLDKSDAQFSGETDYDYSGYSVSNAGDVNGDGYADFLIGAPYRDNSSNTDVGKTYLLFGSKTLAKNRDLRSADASFIGNLVKSRSGWSVAGAGDVNGDGYGDIIIGAPGSDSGTQSAGYAYIFFGHSNPWVKNVSVTSASVVLKGENNTDETGHSVAGVGDVNGDGYDDVLIGSTMNDGKATNAGTVYMVFGRKDGWTTGGNNYFELSKANATFMGEAIGSNLGSSVSAAGDINKDGYDDFLMASKEYNSTNMSAGRAYLFYGAPKAWNRNIAAGTADTIIQGKLQNQRVGTCIAGVGDFDDNGYDDFVVCGGSDTDTGMNYKNRVFLYLSTSTRYPKTLRTSDAVGTYYAGGTGVSSGLTTASGLGDINGDGSADMILGDKTGDNFTFFDAGKGYIITGSAGAEPGSVNVSLSAQTSFVGEASTDGAGFALGGGGDINGDGYSDALISAPNNDQSGLKTNAGRSYLIFPDHNKGPETVNSLSLCSDDACNTVIDHASVGDTVYIKLVGGNGDQSRKDVALVTVNTSRANPVGYRIPLFETTLTSGIYMGAVEIANRTREEHSWIKAVGNETLTVLASNDTKMSANLFVLGNLIIKPLKDVTTVFEDHKYNVHYWVEGCPYSKLTWLGTTEATWLDYIKGTQNFTGTPGNKDVGKYWVDLTVTNVYGQEDTHNFSLTVNNIAPIITSEITTTATEHVKYTSNMTSSEGNSGIVTWHLKTNSSWLKINSTSGQIHGTPEGPDVGIWYANVSVDDGNDGWDSSNATITVINVNDLPRISTETLPPATEDRFYQFQINGSDPDKGDKVKWSIAIGAPGWLSINDATGIIQGTPVETDVGNTTIQVILGDTEGLTVNKTFELKVINVNEPPVITSNPETSAISGKLYQYDVKATDPDLRETLTFSLQSPPTGMSIESNTGILKWTPNEDQKGPNLAQIMVSDGELYGYQNFTINVIVPQSDIPLATLVTPQNGSVVNMTNPQLQWAAEQIGPNPYFFDVYISKDKAKVEAKDPTVQVAEDLSATSFFPTTPLEKGGNYYWTVIPHDGVHTGLCTNGVWNFTVEKDAIVSKKPTVLLNLPVNGSSISALPVQLTWTGANPDATPLTYSVYISQDRSLVKTLDPVALRTSGINVSELKVDDLSRGKTYFWMVIPDNGNIKGDCLSGIWQFSIAAEVVQNHAPVISSKPVTKTYVGDTYTYQINASDEDKDPVSLTLTTRPVGMVIDSGLRLIMWVIKEKDIGDHKVVIRASDGHIYTDQSYTLTVSPLTAKNRVPSISAIPEAKVTVGQKFRFKVVAQDADTGDSLTYSLDTFPEGMTIVQDGTIQWSPKKGQEGTVPVRVKVTDGKDSTYRSFNVTVKAAPSNLFSGTGLLLILILVIVIAVVVAVAVALTMRKRAERARRSKAKAEEEAVSVEPEPVVGAAPIGEAATAAATEPAVVYAAPPKEDGVEDFNISEVFLIYNDGRLITYSTTEEDAGVDKQIMSGMLIAIQGFVKESFKTQHGLNSFEFGNKKVILQGGKHVILAAVLDGTEPAVLRDELRNIITKIETLYAGKIEVWDGNIDTFHEVPHYLAPLFRMRSKLKIKAKAKGVRMRSGVEFYSGYVRLKIGVSNELEGPISNINLDLSYDLNTLRLSHIEPQYPMSDNTVFLPDIQPGEKRSVAVYFDPLICQESHIDGKVRFTDASGNPSETDMKRRPVDVVCPIFYTPETINVAMLKRLLGELSFNDSRIFEVKDSGSLADSHAIAVSCVKGHDVKLVREFVEDVPWAIETWFYGEAKESDEKLVIKVSARSSGNILELFVASDNLASMTGLLAELGKEFRAKLDEKGIDRESLLLSTDDKMRNVLKETALLLDKFADSEASPDENEQNG